MSVDLPDLSRRLFKAAAQLWPDTALRPDQHAQPVLALVALRRMATKFDRVHETEARFSLGIPRLNHAPCSLGARTWEKQALRNRRNMANKAFACVQIDQLPKDAGWLPPARYSMRLCLAVSKGR